MSSDMQVKRKPFSFFRWKKEESQTYGLQETMIPVPTYSGVVQVSASI